MATVVKAVAEVAWQAPGAPRPVEIHAVMVAAAETDRSKRNEYAHIAGAGKYAQVLQALS